MPDLRRTRKNLKTALAIMAGVDLLAADRVFFAAGRLGGNAPAGIEQAADGIDHQDARRSRR